MPHSIYERRQYRISGAVQGVGFRPFVYRLATEYGLNGWIRNDAIGVVIEVEGAKNNITEFESLLKTDNPQNANISFFESKNLIVQNDSAFKIIQSNGDYTLSVTVSPDLAICSDCLEEMNDLQNRRYSYPFINCTNCGPRFTIITGLPYDRPKTTMAEFIMCDECRAEYENPSDRRFHAQPIACPNCGPYIALWDANGSVLSEHNDAILSAVEAVREGKIIAVKGIGGFHLIADAINENTVQLLRQRKLRPNKPFAVMFSSLDKAEQYCNVSEEEAALLSSQAAPIVLLNKNENADIAASIAPNNPYLGVMLPYAPLHHLLLQKLKAPIVATSGNRSNEPICTDENEALERLSGIADLFLVHNRSIQNRADDSIVRVIAERTMVLRRGRGYAPLPIQLKEKTKESILAVGSHMKNTVALAVEDQLILSPHIGDLDTIQTCESHRKSIRLFCDLYETDSDIVACDKHPDYRSTQMARTHHNTLFPVQHHYAHALSCLLDNSTSPPVLAIVWDGTGYGDDGTIWGGEFLHITEEGYERSFHFRTFPLPGGEAAMKNPKRSTYGILNELGLRRSLGFTDQEETLLQEALTKNINCPLTSSAGRLFDAVSTLIGVCPKNTYEGEAAMMLEFAAMKSNTEECYDFEVSDEVVDWGKMVRQILGDLDNEKPVFDMARKFHNTLSTIIVNIVKKSGEKKVLLTGGCFQNKLLLENTIEALLKAGFEAYWHHNIPPNDGGIAAGQIVAALREEKKEHA